MVRADRVHISRASVWEIAIKFSLGKLPLRFPLAVLLGEIGRNRIETLEITDAHALRVAALPHHHRDPFDRMIVAQALAEGLPVVGSDAAFDSYGVRRIF